MTLDSRYALNPTEVARLSAVSQLLGYAELYRVHPSRRFRADIVHRADYLYDRYDEVSSHTAFDGMLEIYFATSDELKAAFGSPVIGMLRKDEETLVQLDAAEIRIVAEEHVL